MSYVLRYYWYDKNTWKKLLTLVCISFMIRAGVFFFYIQHEERYHQPDSMDYHLGASVLATKQTFFNPATGKYNFWRTPGYSVFLMPFYQWYGVHNYSFKSNTHAQKAALWAQLFLCSWICVLVFFLVILLTQSEMLAWMISSLFVIHLGFVLASCYLLTDAPAMLFFFLFLIWFYQAFSASSQEEITCRKHYIFIALAALTLGIYTWIRPNGEFIAYLSMIIMLLCSTAPWLKRCTKMLLFFVVFFASLSPWYLRNYQLTGKWFFCPMQGPYLLAFSAPKVLRRLSQEPLEKCIKYLFAQATQELKEQEKLKKITAPGKVISQELVCKRVAWPWIVQYPHYVAIDWIKEVCKTTFDLYASQLVAFANNCYTFDPLEEFLTEKLSLCIYKQPMPRTMRLLCWLELLFTILLWIGIIGGFLVFFVYAWFKKHTHTKNIQKLWIKTGLMAIGLVAMTGGFGYARLRMPAEPLLIIMSATFWIWLLRPNEIKLDYMPSTNTSNNQLKGKTIA